MGNERLKYVLKICFLAAIEFIFCFTPLGSIPIGPIVATLALIPVIITSLAFGKKEGVILGFIMATFSFIVWTFIMPSNPVAFIFTPFSESAGYKGNIGSLIICFVPRILSGLVPALILDLIAPDMRGKHLSSDVAVIAQQNKTIYHLKQVIASAMGSLTNTILVMILIYVFFGKSYETIMGQPILLIIATTIITNGIPEALIAGIVCPAVSNVLNKL